MTRKKKKKKKKRDDGKSEAVLTLAFKCFAYLMRLSLPSLDKYVPKLAEFLFKILQYGAESMLQSCFKTLGMQIVDMIKKE